MLQHYFQAKHVLRRLRASPAGPYIEGFAAELLARGYAHDIARRYLQTAAHLGVWWQEQGISSGQLDAAAFAGFEGHLAAGPCSHTRSRQDWCGEGRAGARRFLEHLRREGVAPAPACRRTDLPPLVEQFRSWMRQQRGVAESTLAGYVPLVVEFVEALGEQPHRYDAAGVRAFVLRRADRHGRSRAQTLVAAVRMFLRQLIVQGHCPADLIGAVPSVAHWRLAELPRHLPDEAVERILAACDESRPAGLRDRAVLLLLARLGLRAGDVAGLRFTDIDWSGGRLRVAGKGRRQAHLPLPQEVGNALLAYLERGRPSLDDDHVFLRVRAPRRPLGCGSTVSHLVARVMRRAGIRTPSHGAHVLRHSLATKMLRQGASLQGIGALLRHRSIEATQIYAKVDLPSLRQVVQPWPGQEVSPC